MNVWSVMLSWSGKIDGMAFNLSYIVESTLGLRSVLPFTKAPDAKLYRAKNANLTLKTDLRTSALLPL